MPADQFRDPLINLLIQSTNGYSICFHRSSSFPPFYNSYINFRPSIDFDMQPQYTIAPATKEQLPMVEVIQQQLGWDPFKNTHKIVADISPEGVLFGKLGGKIMSSILATKYSKGFGFIGVYYVRKADRGKGYGYKIFVKAMEFLSDCEVLALDSVEEQIPNYVKWGFQVACNSTKRFVKQTPKVDAHRTTRLFSKMADIPLQKVLNFQDKILPAFTSRYLKTSFQIGHPFVSVDKTTGEVLGYAVVTKCHSGLAIAPLIAINDQVAEDLIKEIFHQYPAGKNGKTKDNALVVFTQDEFFKVKTLMQKWFPRVYYNCKRMYFRTHLFTKDFDRSCIYGATGYERG